MNCTHFLGCKIRVGEPCSTNRDGGAHIQPCVMNAECGSAETSLLIPTDGLFNSDLNFMGECVCQPGYSPTPEGSCRKDFGSSCTSRLEECNSHSGLMCKNNSCVCIDDDTYFDQEQGACVSWAGDSCGDFPLWYESYDIGCTENAECVLVGAGGAGAVVGKEAAGTGRKNMVGKMGRLRSCRCKAGFQESKEKEGKTCVPVPDIISTPSFFPIRF